MAYKNSAGVKLPNADIIIEADEDGTVTSCRNIITEKEFISGYKVVNVKFVNNATASRGASLPYITDNQIFYSSKSCPAHTERIYECIAPCKVSAPSNSPVVSGDAVLGTTLVVNGDCTITWN